MAEVEVSREQALASRISFQGLDRSVSTVDDLAVWALGLQETPVGAARLAVATRLPALPDDVGALIDEDTHAWAWTYRGAPHVYRAADVATLRHALWPVSEADALARLAPNGPVLTDAGVSAMDAIARTAREAATAVTAPMPRADLSTALTRALPKAYSRRCDPCGVTHVMNMPFLIAPVFAGIGLVAGTQPAVVAPLPGDHDVPTVNKGLSELITRYLELHGPATLADAAAFLGTKPAAIADHWPDDVVEVSVEGKPAFVPAGRTRALKAARPGDAVRLLGPSDPYLQARDRELLVPAKNRRGEVWKALNSPGAILAGTEIVGVWRAKMAGRSKLAITATPFGDVDKRVRAAVDAEAERVAAVRGTPSVTLTWS